MCSLCGSGTENEFGGCCCRDRRDAFATRRVGAIEVWTLKELGPQPLQGGVRKRGASLQSVASTSKDLNDDLHSTLSDIGFQMLSMNPSYVSLCQFEPIAYCALGSDPRFYAPAFHSTLRYAT